MDLLPTEVLTPRLHLRAWQVDDAEALTVAVHANLEHLRPWMHWIAFEPVSVDDRAQMIAGWTEAWRDGGDAVFGAFLSDGTLVASTGLHRRAGPECLEIGYWVAADHVGNGYATEITHHLTTAAFSVAGIERVELKIDEANEPSARVAARLGFVDGGREPKEAQAPGESGVECCWFVSRDSWPTAPAAALSF